MSRALLLTIFLFSCSFWPVFAEQQAPPQEVERAELSKEAIFKKYPTQDAPAIGRLPKGTLIELTGEEENHFAEMEVELSNGTVATGWVEIQNIKGREAEKRPEKPKPAEEKKNKKIVLPKDEGVLLRREQSFFYGISLGGNYGMVTWVESEELYTGMSFQGSAHAGLYFNSYTRGQLNVGYFRVEGKDSLGIGLGFGFLDISAELQFIIEKNFLIFGSLGYASGIGITAAPSTLKIEGSSDATTISSQVGAGYRAPISDVSSIGVKASYLYGFKRDPVGVAGFLLSVFLDFEG